MLDNLGFGEIAMLALMALLFFGPERLPQIGARIGRWIATLTQSSKDFMNEWRDEALVVYDAVAEVKGIRDEIFAARAEIAGTIDTAREDVGGALSGAKTDVQAQIQGATTFSPPVGGGPRGGQALPPPQEALSPQQGEELAISRTEAILEELREKRERTEPTDLPPGTHHAPHTEAYPNQGATNAHIPPQTTPTPDELDALRTTVVSLEADVRALRDEVARTRAVLEAQVPAEAETPPPLPAQVGEPV
jgi:sec-independent protein translocase protein TatA